MPPRTPAVPPASSTEPPGIIFSIWKLFFLIEVDGDPEIIAREIEAIGMICLQGGASEVLMAPDAVIGALKKQFLPLELTAASIHLQRDLKNLFDPLMILNPGKLFP